MTDHINQDEFEEWLKAQTPERHEVINHRLHKAYYEIMSVMMIQDELDALVAEGLVETVGVDDDGNVQYSLVNTDE